MNDFQDQIRGIVDHWPEEGYVVGLLPDRSDPSWSGRTVLDLIEMADRTGGPSVVVDLAPNATDLVDRFEAGSGPGLAEMEEGEVELWEISHRSDVHRAVYVPQGSGATGAELAGSEATAQLAGQMKDRGRLLIVILDRAGAETAASTGYLDGLVRVGEADGADRYESVPELGRITARPGERSQVPETRDGPRLVLPPEMRSEHRRKRRIRRGLIALAILVVLGLVASSLLGGPGLGDLFSGGDGSSAVVESVDARGERPAAADSLADAPRSASDTVTGGAATSGSSDGATVDTAATPVAGADTPTVEASDDAAGENGEQGPDSIRSTDGSPLSATPEAPESGGPPQFRAVADSLALSVRAFTLQAERFRAGEIGCGTLVEARRRVDRLFERLWLERMSLQPAPDSPAAATFRERSRQMETVEGAYAATSCPAEAIEGS